MLELVVPTLVECANVGPLVALLEQALQGVRWEAVFVM